ncbi:hypothetical protein [Chondromyces apiculatus]|uniref:TolA protein n=1 Tax=Chondromyces apiculatus DSM 436 TaxID=1192034 RepID=A0A017T0R2_9BACT|nr:hypothetical protein [Chondromyces apiculatus]EYF02450.1 Hypothetical protein CAP_7072 [Chondromyces apiculatus DSM 436]
MSEQKESSVLFSLKELMNLEEDRIKTEEHAKAAAATAAEQARLDAERRAREAEESRIRAEEERRRVEEQRSREEAARLDAIRHAEVERARVEAEQHARIAALSAQQEHEQKLAALKHDESKKKLRKLLIGVVSGVVVLGALAGFLVKREIDERDRQTAAQQAAMAEANEKLAKLEAERVNSEKKEAELKRQLDSAKDEATRLALQKQLEAEQEKQKQIKGAAAGAGAGKGAGAGAGSKPCNCSPGDPLCSCL